MSCCKRQLWVLVGILTVSTFPPGASAGLVSYWALDDLSGTTALDSADGNHGTLVGNASFVAPGRLGASALQLSPSAPVGYVKAGDPANLDFERTQPFTVAAWVKAPTGQDATIVGKMIHGGSYAGYELHVGSSAGAGKANVWLLNTWPSNAIEVNSSKLILDNTWHHVVFTYDGSSQGGGVKVYVDGVLDSGSTITKNALSGSILNNAELNLGSRSNGVAHNLNGMLDEVAVWNQALNSAEIATVYHYGVPMLAAGEIPVPNGSFEQPATTTFNTDAAVWNDPGSGTGVFINNGTYGNRIINGDGGQLAFMNTDEGSEFFQELPETYEPGKAYTLTVGVAARSDNPGNATDMMEMRLFWRDSGGTAHVLGATPVAYGSLSNTYLTNYEVTIPYVAPGDPWVGRPIGIWLRSTAEPLGGSGDWTLDNVRLTALGVPEPATGVLLGVGALGALWLVLRRCA